MMKRKTDASSLHTCDDMNRSDLVAFGSLDEDQLDSMQGW